MAVCGSCAATLPDGANFCLVCGAAQVQATDDGLVGQMLGNYQIIAELGEGAMGKVYRAVQTTLGRTVCVKTLLPHLASDRTLIARFEREARAASALRHPNIVGVLDFGKTDAGMLYIVMELVEGDSLRALIEALAPFSIARAVGIAEQILSALAEAHAAGVVHRDLKPENVLVDRLRDGSDLVKIVDFGIAKTVDAGDAKLTQTGMIYGTPGYMAPEQIRGEVVDERIDIYATGVILYEMLTAKPLFDAQSLQQLLYKHMTATPEPPSARSPLSLPAALDDVVMAALALRPEERVGNALELKRRLGAMRTDSVSRSGPATSCARCGMALQRPDQPCPQCATAFGRQGPITKLTSDVGDEAAESLRRLMPQKLVEHVAELGTLLSGEKRYVTVLFGDISGFTAMSERMEAEEVRDLMNRCFDGMVEAVYRYDGTVDKFIGDCIMVLFGVPKTHEDDPERAIRCATDMLTYLEEVNRTLPVPLGMRIGINTGEVVAGGVGGQRRMDFTVMGDVVNVAQRLESNARVGSILVGEATWRLTSKVFRYRQLPPLQVKGKRDPLDVYEVESLIDVDDGASTELIGQQRIVTLLNRLVQRAVEGHGAGLVLLGEPGTGKTRLLQEAGRLAEANGLTVAHARGGRFVADTHLHVLRQAVFSVCGIEAGQSGSSQDPLATLLDVGLSAPQQDRVRHLLGTATGAFGFDGDNEALLDRAALSTVFLGALSTPPQEGDRRASPRPATSTGKGLCLLVDDAHLADAASLQMLAHIVDQAGDRAFAVMVTARPGDSDRLMPQLHRMGIPPLGPDEVVAVANQFLPGVPMLPSVADTITQRADGNPMFAREIVRSLVDSGRLALTGGTWAGSMADLDDAVPDSLRLIIRAQLDRLSPSGRALLRVAAVIGRTFSLELVQAAVEADVDAHGAVAECLHRNIIGHAEGVPGAFEFVQVMVQESVLASLTKADRRHLHLRLAEALEGGASAGGEQVGAAMARHFLAAGQVRKAIRYLEYAGGQLFDRHAFGASAEAYEQAFELALARVRAGGTKSEAAADYVYRLATRTIQALTMVSPADGLAIADSALETVPERMARSSRAVLLHRRGEALRKLGRVHEAERALNEALGLLTGAGNAEAAALVAADLADALEARGDLAGASQQLMDGLARLSGARAQDSNLMRRYLDQLGRLHIRTGASDKALDFFDNALAHARRSNNLAGESRVTSNLASLAAMRGDAAKARALFQDALSLAERAGDLIGVARVRYNVGRLLLRTKDTAGAESWFVRSLATAREIGWREGIATASQAIAALRGKT